VDQGEGDELWQVHVLNDELRLSRKMKLFETSSTSKQVLKGLAFNPGCSKFVMWSFTML